MSVIEDAGFGKQRIDLQTYLRIAFYLHQEASKILKVKSLLNEADEEPLLDVIGKVETVFKLGWSEENYEFAQELLLS